jgi:hypothetical protein
MRVRILRAPPARFLEGIDLGPAKLQPGSIHELSHKIADVLIVWEYAERVVESDPLRPGSTKQPA